MREPRQDLPVMAALLVAILALILPGVPVQAAGLCGQGVSKTTTVSTFYRLLDHGNYRDAFACYGARFRADTTYTTWRQGYSGSLHSQLLSPPKLQSGGAVAVSVLATDAQAGHRVYSTFSGTWTLVQQNGWRLDSATIHLISRRAGPSLAFNDSLLTRLARTAPRSRLKLPESLPFAAHGVTWDLQPIEGGFTIVLGRGAPIADANTLFTETVTDSSVPTPGVDGKVTLLNGNVAYYSAPFNHGGNGQPDLEWSQDHIAYQITYACAKNCLAHLTAIADSLQAYRPPPS